MCEQEGLKVRQIKRRAQC